LLLAFPGELLDLSEEAFEELAKPNSCSFLCRCPGLLFLVVGLVLVFVFLLKLIMFGFEDAFALGVGDDDPNMGDDPVASATRAALVLGPPAAAPPGSLEVNRDVSTAERSHRFIC